MEELLEQLALCPNRYLDFGPTLSYAFISEAYTVEKLTVWSYQDDDKLQLVALQTKGMPRARVQGILYSLTDAQIYTLDKEHDVGVCFTRKRLPVYLPFNDEEGNCLVTYAYIYVGINQFWINKIDFDQQFKYGVHRGKHFQQLDRYQDPDPLLNWCYRFLPPKTNGNGSNLHVPESIIKNTKKRNRAEMRRLNLRNFIDDDV